MLNELTIFMTIGVVKNIACLCFVLLGQLKMSALSTSENVCMLTA